MNHFEIQIMLNNYYDYIYIYIYIYIHMHYLGIQRLIWNYTDNKYT